eukprot:gene6367-4592_t
MGNGAGQPRAIRYTHKKKREEKRDLASDIRIIDAPLHLPLQKKEKAAPRDILDEGDEGTGFTVAGQLLSSLVFVSFVFILISFLLIEIEKQKRILYFSLVRSFF